MASVATRAGAAAAARRPPLIADRCLRTQLISSIAAPQASSERVSACFSARRMPGAGLASRAEPPPEARQTRRSSAPRPERRARGRGRRRRPRLRPAPGGRPRRFRPRGTARRGRSGSRRTRRRAPSSALRTRAPSRPPPCRSPAPPCAPSGGWGRWRGSTCPGEKPPRARRRTAISAFAAAPSASGPYIGCRRAPQTAPELPAPDWRARANAYSVPPPTATRPAAC